METFCFNIFTRKIISFCLLPFDFALKSEFLGFVRSDRPQVLGYVQRSIDFCRNVLFLESAVIGRAHQDTPCM